MTRRRAVRTLLFDPLILFVLLALGLAVWVLGYEPWRGFLVRTFGWEIE